MSLAPGSSFGPYRVMEPLGRGGMASVFKAYEAGLDRYVALKVLPAEFLHDPTFAERFRREAKVVARLEHPNIIPIYAFDIEKGIPWMAMRLVPGGSLSTALRNGPLAPEKTVAILRGVAAALAYAHEKGVVHRDVKPQNILLDEAERVYLADFGIARMLEGSAALTQTGMITGTPQYMAPEQATAGTPDHRADIYALGIVAYEMLTGRVPFSADTPVAVLLKHCTDPMPLPDRALVPDAVVRPLLKCTAKKPEDRWPSPTAFVDALDQGFAEARAGRSTATLAAPGSQPTLVTTVPARRPSSTVVPQQPPTIAGPAPAGTRRGLVVAAAAALVLALGVAALALLTLGRPETGPETTAADTASPAASPADVALPAEPEAASVSPDSEPPLSTSAAQTVEPAPVPAARRAPSTSSAPARTSDAKQPISLAPEPVPVRAAAPAPSTLVARPSLHVDLEVYQELGHDWTEVLHVGIKLGDDPVRLVSLSFPGKTAARRRESVVFDGPPPGVHRLLIMVSSRSDMTASDLVQGAKQVTVAEGANRVAVQIRFGDEAAALVQFRQP